MWEISFWNIFISQKCDENYDMRLKSFVDVEMSQEITAEIATLALDIWLYLHYASEAVQRCNGI